MQEQRRTGQGEIEQAVVEGRMFTLQIEKSLLPIYQLAAKNSSSTLKVITDREGEKYPARIRSIRALVTENGSVKFYEWQTVTNTVRAGNIVIGVKHLKGDTGLMDFWQEHGKLNQRASKTPAKV